MAQDQVTVTLTKVEALALARVAEYGVDAAKAFGLIPNTTTAEHALRRLKDATGRRKSPGA